MLGSIITRDSISDTLMAFIYKQNPMYGPEQELHVGSTIDIWIQQDEVPVDPYVDSVMRSQMDTTSIQIDSLENDTR